jgi:hypothetical protein
LDPKTVACRRYSHVAPTLTLVLEGEKHLLEIQPHGAHKAITRKAGDDALAPPHALPHIECGGDGGGTVLLSIAQYVEAWNNGATYRLAPTAR